MNNDIFSIFSISKEVEFNKCALETFHFQYENNKIYREYADAIHTKINKIAHYKQIPFLPIEFFKTQEIMSGNFKPEAIFESSGTTGAIKSKHYVKDLKLYEESFTRGFEYFYGKPEEYCILALLPDSSKFKVQSSKFKVQTLTSKIHSTQSSLIYMVRKLIEMSKHQDSGFYLNDLEKLSEVLRKLSESNIKTILFGVSYALVDFVKHSRSKNVRFNTPINKLIIMETGGMKGKGKDIIREELHDILCDAFGVKKIHSEYGMTELLSQAYSKGEGLFKCPPWMRILARDMNDPFAISEHSFQTNASGGLNIIDLSNRYSCSFIETKDICKIHPDSSGFEVAGRMDNSDIRGCNQLIMNNE